MGPLRGAREAERRRGERRLWLRFGLGLLLLAIVGAARAQKQQIDGVVATMPLPEVGNTVPDQRFCKPDPTSKLCDWGGYVLDLLIWLVVPCLVGFIICCPLPCLV